MPHGTWEEISPPQEEGSGSSAAGSQTFRLLPPFDPIASQGLDRKVGSGEPAGVEAESCRTLQPFQHSVYTGTFLFQPYATDRSIPPHRPRRPAADLRLSRGIRRSVRDSKPLGGPGGPGGNFLWLPRVELRSLSERP